MILLFSDSLKLIPDSIADFSEQNQAAELENYQKLIQKEIEMNANTGEILEADFEDKEDTPLEKTAEEPNGWTKIEAPKEENATAVLLKQKYAKQ